MMLQPGKQTIAIHILPNILGSKGNQTIKSDQLIEYVTENIASVKLLPGRLPLTNPPTIPGLGLWLELM